MKSVLLYFPIFVILALVPVHLVQAARLNCLDGQAEAILEPRKKEFISSFLPSTKLTPAEFAQAGYGKMKSMQNMAATPGAQVMQIIQETRLADLKKFEEIAKKRQVELYERLQQTVESLKKEGTPESLIRAEKLSKIRSKDPIALGNGPHVTEVVQTFSQNEATFRKLFADLGLGLKEDEFQHAFQYLKTLAWVHDLGKTFVAEPVLEIGKKAAASGGNGFVIGRISLHELGSAAEINWLRKTKNLDEKTGNSLIRNILGHNDGSGLPGVWWNKVGHEPAMLGQYPIPDTVFAKLLAIADRGGSASLGASGGSMKITRQRLTGPGHGVFGKALLEETMVANSESAQAQIKKIAQDFKNDFGLEIESTPMVQKLLSLQKDAIHAVSAVKWNPDNVSGQILGRKFANVDEFFQIINDAEAVRSAPDFWSKAAQRPGEAL